MIESIEIIYDKFFNIDTSINDNDDKLPRKIFTQYQPTHYAFLEYLYKKYPFVDTDCLVDFGAGKGRPIVMAAYYGCKHVIGYEYDEVRASVMNNNLINFKKKFNIDFKYEIFSSNASNAIITDEMNKFFFFSPFHLKIYIHVLNNIVSSVNSIKRPINLFLYGPDDTVIKYIDSLLCFKQVESNRYHKKSNSKYIENYEYVIYSNI